MNGPSADHFSRTTEPIAMNLGLSDSSGSVLQRGIVKFERWLKRCVCKVSTTRYLEMIIPLSSR